MPAPRYRVTGVPVDQAPMVHGATAFLPHYHRMAASGAQKYKYFLPDVGLPGVNGPAQAIPMDGQQRNANTADGFTMVFMGTSTSQWAPDVFCQDNYNPVPEPSYWPGAGMPVQVYEPTRPWMTTMIPVPAVNPALALRQQSAVLSAGVESQQDSKKRAMYDTPRTPSWLPRRRKGGGLPNPAGRTNGSA
jgi:hypothetical protein